MGNEKYGPPVEFEASVLRYESSRNLSNGTRVTVADPRVVFTNPALDGNPRNEDNDVTDSP
ncbi:MAG: hypothetical protein C4325_01275 [Blastocatellia bacterium]